MFSKRGKLVYKVLSYCTVYITLPPSIIPRCTRTFRKLPDHISKRGFVTSQKNILGHGKIRTFNGKQQVKLNEKTGKLS